MSLWIDTPRWAWRGHLWAHLISDESLDELHAAARQIGLRWLSFGRDHYDVPDELWPTACSLATVVDSREIVRSLRRSGLRVAGGKPAKAWKRADELPERLATAGVDEWRTRLEARLANIACDTEVLRRPGEWVVLYLLDQPAVPPLGSLASPPDGAVAVIGTDNGGRNGGRASIELVLHEP